LEIREGREVGLRGERGSTKVDNTEIWGVAQQATPPAIKTRPKRGTCHTENLEVRKPRALVDGPHLLALENAPSQVKLSESGTAALEFLNSQLANRREGDVKDSNRGTIGDDGLDGGITHLGAVNNHLFQLVLLRLCN